MSAPRAIPRIRLVILGLILAAVLIVGGGYLYLRDLTGGGHESEAVAAQRASFMASCKQQGRIANGGGALAMDDATEEALDRYCGCVADRLEQTLDPIEIGKIGDGSATPDILAKLERIVAACRVQVITPSPDNKPADSQPAGN